MTKLELMAQVYCALIASREITERTSNDEVLEKIEGATNTFTDAMTKIAHEDLHVPLQFKL